MDDSALNAWIGRTETTEDIAAAGPVARLAALLDHDGGIWRPGDVPPPIATLLMDHFLRANPGQAVSRFRFRAQSPPFDTAPFALNQAPEAGGAALWAARLRRRRKWRWCKSIDPERTCLCVMQ